MCVSDSRQHSLLHDEGERVEDTLTHLRLQWREEVRDDLQRQRKERRQRRREDMGQFNKNVQFG